MNYMKPEVAVVGEAVRVIEVMPLVKDVYPAIDRGLYQVNPAYDLDE
jgi:hypothetical protein